MLPPAEPAVLSSHPRFEALYNDLRSNKLAPDGSSALDAKAERERDQLGQELRQARIHAAKHDLIITGLHELAYKADALPDELQELVTVAAAVLAGQIPSEDVGIVQNEVELFKDHAKTITSTLSQQIQSNVDMATELSSTDRLASQSQVDEIIDSTKRSKDASRRNITNLRMSLAMDAIKLHHLYRQVLETIIRTLEQTIHGSVSRATKAQADYLAVVAEGMSKKLAVQHGQLLSQLYTGEFQTALKASSESITKELRTCKRQADDAEEKLLKYQSARNMGSLSKEYSELLREIARTKGEIDRLEADT